MQVVNIHEAKTHLSKLIDLAYEGEDIIICKAGKPVGRLVKYQKGAFSRASGYWKGKVKIAADFDQLPEHLVAAFRGDTH